MKKLMAFAPLIVLFAMPPHSYAQAKLLPDGSMTITTKLTPGMVTNLQTRLRAVNARRGATNQLSLLPFAESIASAPFAQLTRPVAATATNATAAAQTNAPARGPRARPAGK